MRGLPDISCAACGSKLNATDYRYNMPVWQSLVAGGVDLHFVASPDSRFLPFDFTLANNGSDVVRVSVYTYPDGVVGVQHGISLSLNVAGQTVRGHLCSWSCMMQWLEEKVLPDIAIRQLT